MNILYYSPHPNLSLSSSAGYSTHMNGMIIAFKELGHNVFCQVMGGQVNGNKSNGNTSYRDSYRNIFRILLPKTLINSIKDYRLLKTDKRYEHELHQIVNRQNIDLIYERTNGLQISGSRIASKINIPHIIEMNTPYNFGDDANRKSLFSGKAHAINKKRMDSCLILAAVSSALKDYIIERYKISADKIIVTPNAVNPNTIKIDGILKDELKSKLKLKGNIVIGFVGSMYKWHGIDILLKAYKYLRINNSNIKLLLVGYSQNIHNLKKIAREMGIRNEVIFMEAVSHETIFTYIDLMDITVMPNSNWYGSPVKIFEYGALGKPIIAPDTMPVRDVMTNGIDGLLVKPDENALLSALHSLIHNKNMRHQLGNSFKQKVLSTHTWDNNARYILEAVSERINLNL